MVLYALKRLTKLKQKIMKSIKINAGGMVLILATVLITSCTKTFDEKITLQNDFNNSTIAQVIIATVGASRNTVYLDGKQVSGSLMVSGSLFPTASAYGFVTPPGLRSFTIKDTLSTSTQVPLTFSTNMQVGKYYTIFMYDTTTSPKQVTVPANIVEIRDTTCRMRFANFVYSPAGLPAIDIYSFARGTNLVTNLPSAGVSDFISYPTRLATDTFYFRETGTQNLLLKLTITGGFTERRHYTTVYRGSAPRGTYVGSRTLTTFTNY
jgi:hypothetical protein